MIQRVLITGSRGFTGQYLLAELRNHTDIVAIEFAGDLLDSHTIQTQIEQHQPDAIINLAGISFVPDADNILVYQLHTLATEQLLQYARQSKTVQRVILVSSSVIYGLNPTPVETDCPAPLNHYGISKLAMEHIAKNYQDDLEIVITRPFNYTGSGQAAHFLIPKLVQHFQRKAAQLELGNMQIARDFSDVRWVVKIYVALLTQDNVAGIYNICAGSSYSLQEILHYLENSCQHKPHYRVNPDYVRSNDLRKQQGCNQKLQHLLPDLKTDSIFNTLDWMLLTQS